MRKDITAQRKKIKRWISEKQSKAFMCRELQCRPGTLNYWLDKMGIKYRGNKSSKGVKKDSSRISALDYLKKDFPRTHVLRLKLLEDGVKDHRCERCKNTEWLRGPIPLELHHVNGNRFDNRLRNLKMLCPNCHSLTPTDSGKKLRKKQRARGGTGIHV